METKGYIYIMTNRAFTDYVKIGYASDVERRRRELSTTALPFDYEVYATYETPTQLSDLELHKLLDTLDPDLRVNKNREFFSLTPEDAYKLLRAIAKISGTEDRLKLLVNKVIDVDAERTRTNKKYNFNELDEEVYNKEFMLRNNTANATAIGYFSDNHKSFIVKAGAKFAKDVVNSIAERAVRVRNEIINDDMVNDSYILLEDYEFTSPSRAAEVITGGRHFNYKSWLDEDGKTMKDYRGEEEEE